MSKDDKIEFIITGIGQTIAFLLLYAYIVIETLKTSQTIRDIIVILAIALVLVIISIVICWKDAYYCYSRKRR